MKNLIMPRLESQASEICLTAEQSAQIDGLATVLQAMLRASPIHKRAASQVNAGLIAILEVALSANRSSQVNAGSELWQFSLKQIPGMFCTLDLTKNASQQQLHFQLDPSGQFFGEFYWLSSGDSTDDIAIFEMIREGTGWALVKKDREEPHSTSRLPLVEPPGGLPWSEASFQTILGDLFKESPEISIQDLFNPSQKISVQAATPPPEPFYCMKCGAVLRPQAKFCQQCGVPQRLASDCVLALEVSAPVSSDRTNQQTGLCPRCGDPIRETERFCNQCGLPLESALPDGNIICQQCGQPNRPRSRFCKKCGNRLST